MSGAFETAPHGPQAPSPWLDRRAGGLVFLAFAAAYFCSALVRSITATLAPVLTQEFSLHARDLGLLGGGYFLGFAAMQLPLGSWLDRLGPRRVILYFLSVAVLGCLAFSEATSFAWLLASRVLIGMGVSACMMAALTGYRRWFDGPRLLRANSWMLMTGSLGMLASTLPVQWLMPLVGWRPLFWILALLIAGSMAVIAWVVPAWRNAAPTLATASASGALPLTPEVGAECRGSEPASAGLDGTKSGCVSQPCGLQGLRLRSGEAGPAAPAGEDGARTLPAAGVGSDSYAQVWRSGYFRRFSPLGFFNYGGLVAIQTLWAGPWMIRVAGYTPLQAATGLFYINAAMLLTFWLWGLVNPLLAQRGWSADRLVTWGIPLSLLILALNIAGGPGTGWFGWAAFCVASSVMGLAQPAVGMAFNPSLAGRALSGYNLVIFAGVFVVQWGLGLSIDGFSAAGLTEVASFQAAMGVFLLCCLASYAYFLANKSTGKGALAAGADNSPS